MPDTPKSPKSRALLRQSGFLVIVTLAATVATGLLLSLVFAVSGSAYDLALLVPFGAFVITELAVRKPASLWLRAALIALSILPALAIGTGAAQLL